jgi:hypothetical protein
MKKRFMFVCVACLGAVAVFLAVLNSRFADSHNRRVLPIEQGLAVIPNEAEATVYEEVAYVDYAFTICNRGASIVKLERIIPGCGCTAATLDKSTLAPGQTAKLIVRYDVRPYLGKIPRRDIHVVSDDKTNPMLTCAVSGTRLPRFRISPRVVAFGDIPAGTSGEAEVSVETMGPGMKLVPERMIVDSQWVAAEVLSGAVKATGSHYLVKVRLDKNAPEGEIQARLFIPRAQDDGVGPVIQVNANIVGIVRAVPSRVFLGFCRPGQSVERQVRVVRLKEREATAGTSEGNDVYILGWENVPPWLSMEVNPERQSQIRMIAAVPLAMRPGVIDEAVVVKYAVKGQECRVRIPVSGMVIE